MKADIDLTNPLAESAIHLRLRISLSAVLRVYPPSSGQAEPNVVSAISATP